MPEIDAERLERQWAAMIRDAYLSLARRYNERLDVGRLPRAWEGGRDSMGRQHQPIWPKLARRAIKEGLSPVGWVETLFRVYPPSNDDLPEPRRLFTERVIDAARQARRDYAEGAACQLRSEISLAQRKAVLISAFTTADNLRPNGSILEVIRDPTLELSPLTRYLVALQINDTELLACLEQDAISQWACYREAYATVTGPRFVSHMEELWKKTQKTVPFG